MARQSDNIPTTLLFVCAVAFLRAGALSVWLLSAFLVGAIVYWVADEVRYRRERIATVRRYKGLCEACGYDVLSGGLTRCPECGLALPMAAPRPTFRRTSAFGWNDFDFDDFDDELDDEPELEDPPTVAAQPQELTSDGPK